MEANISPASKGYVVDYAEAIRQLFLGNTKPCKPTDRERIRESIRQDYLAATRRRLFGVG